MDLIQLLKIAKRWLWLGAIPVVVVALYLGLTYQPPPTTYQVVLRFTAGSEPAADLSPDYDRYYAWLTSEYIANGLADFAQTSHFARGVADRLAERDIIVPPEAVQGALVTDNAQSVAVIYLTWPDPEQAVAVAEAVSAELVEVGPRYFPQMQNVGLVAQQADIARALPMAPGLRTQLLGPALRLALALALGAGLVLLAHFIDPWIHEPADITALNLEVVGIIPRVRPGHRGKG
jgi:capsular polysaccharide biosynthesis protein